MIYDTYRPQRSVDKFIEWAKDDSDLKMKDLYYPGLTGSKKWLFDNGYIAAKSVRNLIKYAHNLVMTDSFSSISLNLFHQRRCQFDKLARRESLIALQQSVKYPISYGKFDGRSKVNNNFQLAWASSRLWLLKLFLIFKTFASFL